MPEIAQNYMTFHRKNMGRRLLAGRAVLLIIAITVLTGCTVQPVRPESTPQGETQSDATTSPSADSPAETKTGAADASPTPDSGSGGTGKDKPPAPKTRSTPDDVTTVTGRAMWNGEPLTGPGIEIVAVADHNRDVWTPVATTSVDADGYFTIAFSGSVTHMMEVSRIDGMGVGIFVEPNLGEMVDIGNVNVPKQLTVLTPENNTSTTSTPTFTWEAFPGAVKYVFTIVDNSTDKVVSSTDVGGATEYVSEIPFTANTHYRWKVHAWTESTEIAFSDRYTFKVVSSAPESTAAPG